MAILSTANAAHLHRPSNILTIVHLYRKQYSMYIYRNYIITDNKIGHRGTVLIEMIPIEEQSL